MDSPFHHKCPFRVAEFNKIAEFNKSLKHAVLFWGQSSHKQILLGCFLSRNLIAYLLVPRELVQVDQALQMFGELFKVLLPDASERKDDVDGCQDEKPFIVV